MPVLDTDLVTKLFRKSLIVMSLSLAACGGSSGVDQGGDEPIREPMVESLKAQTDMPLGVAVPAAYYDYFSNDILQRPDLQDVVVQHFSQITAENIMKSSYLQPAQGVFEWQWADQLVQWALDNKLTVHGHALVWHSQMPTWMEQFDGDAGQWQAMLDDHVSNVASHFNGKVVSWDVVNEALSDCASANDSYCGDSAATYPYRNSVLYQNLGADFIAAAFRAAHQADSSVPLYYNDYNISANGLKMDALITMVEGLLADSVPIDGIGFQMHVDYNWPDITSIRSAFRRAAATGLLVKITELDLKMNPNGQNSRFTAAMAEQQLERYQQIVTAYLEEVPSEQQGGVSFWGVSDADSWIPHHTGHEDWPLLFDQDLKQKPAIEGVEQALITAQ